MGLSGMRACYISLTDEWADKIAEAEDGEERISLIEHIMEEKLCPVYEMDKWWEELHLLLTGKSASEPIEGDPLSEAIVGVHVVEAEDDCYIGAIGYDELASIIDELKQAPLDTLQQQYKGSEKHNKTWMAAMMAEIDHLVAFYEQSQSEQRDILVSIY